MMSRTGVSFCSGCSDDTAATLRPYVTEDTGRTGKLAQLGNAFMNELPMLLNHVQHEAVVDLDRIEHHEGTPVAAVAPTSEWVFESWASEVVLGLEERSALLDYLIAAGCELFA